MVVSPHQRGNPAALSKNKKRPAQVEKLGNPKMKNTTRIAVEIVRSTTKAHLVKDASGRETWIQARWLKEDGTVSADTFERGAAAKAERVEAAAAARLFRESHHLIKIARETEKAIAAEVILETPGGFETPTLVWFPKSRAELLGDGTAAVPGWMILAKEEEAPSNWRSSSYYESHRFAKGERPRVLRGVQIIAAAAANL